MDYDGSGIIAKKLNHWQLRGIKLLSHSENDICDPKKPALFIDVAQYVDWIENVMKSRFDEDENYDPDTKHISDK